VIRTILGVVAGVIAWAVLVTVLNLGLRVFWPDYAAVEKEMAFDFPMMLARLAESTLALVVAALLTGFIAKGSLRAPWALGIVLLVIFVPIHVGLWAVFPIWYHLYFLGSLVLVSGFVGNVRAARQVAHQPQ